MKTFQLSLLALLLAMPLSGIAQEATPGDVNGDGQLTVKDVTALIDLLLSGDEAPSSADVNDDGVVNINDVTDLIDTLLTSSSTPIVDDRWVDLGLPSGTIWATRNVGANRPEEYGDFFAWGETVTKDYYGYSNYKWCNGEDMFTKYCTLSEYGYNGFVDNKTELEPADDAACARYPGGRMPSLEQFQELKDFCSFEYVQQDTVYGALLTGPNGNTIFLPAAGTRQLDKYNDENKYGYYWSRTLDADHPEYTYGLAIFNRFVYVSTLYFRCYAYSLRAVRNQ